MRTGKNNSVRETIALIILFLAIELLDELVDGVRGAAWPLIRHDLQLSYVQIGLVLTLPNVIGSVIEPFLGIWSDLGQRRPLILAGGLAFAIALGLISISQEFDFFLIGFIVLNPASGSFVSLSQASLMDLEPTRHEQNMARWALAGSLGNVAGPLLLAGVNVLQRGWRGAFCLLAILTGLLLILLWRYPTAAIAGSHSDPAKFSFKHGIWNAIAALKRPSVFRWLALLEFSDLMLDILRGFIALYFVDVMGANPTQASLAVSVWLGFGLLGDFLLIPLLERIRGLDYLKISASLVLCIYPVFLVSSNLTIKLIILGCLGLLNAGWYSILKGQLYSTMPGQSGAVLTLSNITGFVGSFIPLMLGFVAQQIGLQSAMWLLLAAPIALLLGLPSDLSKQKQ